jgi:hypothetical protein
MSASSSLYSPVDRSNFDLILATLLEHRANPRRVACLFAPEADWHMNGDQAGWAYAGRRSSRESILSYLGAFAVEYEQLNLTRLGSVIDGEQACVQYQVELRHCGTQKTARLDGLCFVRLEGELIVEVNEFIDSAALFRLGESAA